MNDTLHAVARYAPTPESMATEWTAARQDDVLTSIIGEHADRFARFAEVPLQVGAGPRVGSRRTLPLAASVAALTAAAIGIVALSLPGGTDRAAPAGGQGPVFDPPAGLSDRAVPAGSYSYRVVEQIQLGDDGRPVPSAQNAMVDRSYLDAAGDIVSFRTGSQDGCFRFSTETASLSEPSVALLAALPTDVTALENYLRSHVQGSSSLDEAVFVAVGDALRTADGLASPRLRAAMLGVLSRTAGVYMHHAQPDYLGRPAIRADFVDQRLRPGEVHSLYFDPTTFQLLEERTGTNGQPAAHRGPSPAYTAPAPPGVDPAQLSGAALVQVMTQEVVVDSLPKIPPGCH